MTERVKHLIETSTGKTEGWVEVDGPSTGVGIERWYTHPDGLQAYVVDDQGSMRIEVTGRED